MRKLFFALGFSMVALFASAFGQQNADEGKPYVEAMNKLSFMFGEWEGTGWMQMGASKSEYKVKESVHPRAGGTVVSFEGIGSDKTTGRVGHNAYGVLGYDVEKKEYSLRSYVMNGRSGLFPVKVGDRSIIWEMNAGPRQVRYSISIDAKGQWVEKGEVKLDGDRWMQFMEMTLKKISS